jgi:histidyl-tRNA synthetase
MLTQAPKGTKDILPDEIQKWNYVGRRFTELCSRFGYKEIRIPVFEHTELFQRVWGIPPMWFRRDVYLRG